MSSLSWRPKKSRPSEWEPGDWQYLINSLEQLEAGEVAGLLSRPPGVLQFPEQVRWTFGPYDLGLTEDLESLGYYHSRVWAIYKDDQEQVWVLRSNDDFTGVDFKDLAPWSPQGSEWPSIEFDDNGNLLQAVQFRPAGQDEFEIWIVRHGQSPVKVVEGERPLLYRDPTGDILLFYHDTTDPDETKILYRSVKTGVGPASELPGLKGRKWLKAIRSFSVPRDRWYTDVYSVALYGMEDEPKVTRYVMAATEFYEPDRETLPVADAAALGVEFGEIVWEEMVKRTEGPIDAAALGVEFESIRWNVLGDLEELAVDAAELSVSFGDVQWNELVFVTESPLDKAELSVSFGTILWIGVGD